jgi:hypothetical protein
MLGQIAPQGSGLPPVENKVYEVPFDKGVVIRSIVLCNWDGTTDDVVSLWITTNSYDTPADTDLLMFEYSVPAGKTIAIKCGYTMSSGQDTSTQNALYVGSSAGVTTVSVFGVEI